MEAIKVRSKCYKNLTFWISMFPNIALINARISKPCDLSQNGFVFNPRHLCKVLTHLKERKLDARALFWNNEMNGLANLKP